MDKAMNKIENEIAKLQRKHDQLKASLRRMEEVKRIVQAMRDTAITPQEVAEAFGTRHSRKTGPAKSGRGHVRGPVAPKYRHPTTGASWSGRGRTPRWLAAEEGAGKSREEYRIETP